MRLIDADALEKAINKLKFQVNMNEEVGHNRPFIDIANVLKCLDEQPTAYNVDTVVAELDKKAKRHGGEDYFVEFGDAVEIVKQGGITYDCNNCANYTEPDEIDNGCYLCCKGYENNYKPKVDNSGAFEDVCEWKPDKAFDGMYKACSGYVTYLKGFKYCPYCGKKIKVVE